MNINNNIINSAGISLGNLEMASEYLYGDCTLYEPELSRIKNDDNVKEPTRKDVKVASESVIAKFNIEMESVAECTTENVNEQYSTDIWETEEDECIEIKKPEIRYEEESGDLDYEYIDDLEDEESAEYEESAQEVKCTSDTEEEVLAVNEVTNDNDEIQYEDEIDGEDEIYYEDDEEDDLDEEDDDNENGYEYTNKNKERHVEIKQGICEDGGQNRGLGSSRQIETSISTPVKQVRNESVQIKRETAPKPIEKIQVTKVDITAQSTDMLDSIINNASVSKSEKKAVQSADVEPSIDYSDMEINTLAKHVREFLNNNGVKRGPVDIEIVNNKFGSNNINKLIKKCYIMRIGKGVTIGI